MSTIDILKSQYKYREIYIEVNKKHLFVRVFEHHKTCDNSLPIILIPGGPGADSSIFFAEVDFFIKIAPIILYDPRNTGKSDKGSRNLEADAEDIEAIRQSLGIAKWAVLGVSGGGMIAQAYAIKYQQYLDKLILVVTAPSSEFLSQASANIAQWEDQEQKIIAKKILSGTMPTDEHIFNEEFSKLKSRYALSTSQDDTTSLLGSSVNFSIHSLNEGFTGYLRDFDFTPKLPTIKIPTLVIGAKYDWICDATFSYKISDKIPNSFLAILPGGHSLFKDCKQYYVNTISQFLT